MSLSYSSNCADVSNPSPATTILFYGYTRWTVSFSVTVTCCIAYCRIFWPTQFTTRKPAVCCWVAACAVRQVADQHLGYGYRYPESDSVKAIFQEFHRLDYARRLDEKGLGLGLAICDRIARMLNHTIDVSSRPGTAAVFRSRYHWRRNPTRHRRNSRSSSRPIPSV